MNKKLLITFFLILFTFVSVYALEDEEKNLEYIGFNIDENSNVNKVSYYIVYSSEIMVDKFKLDIYYNGDIKDTCEKNLEPGSDVISEKVTCEVSKYGAGEYKFVSKIFEGNSLVYELSDIEYINNSNIYLFEKEQTNLEFIDMGDKTIVVIYINKKGENLRVLTNISKEVIPVLTEENKKQLITTDFDYEIVESDPLIAWTVDKAPTKINYTINKKVSIEEQKKFVVSIEETSLFNKLKWLIYILIAMIIFFALRPAFKR